MKNSKKENIWKILKLSRIPKEHKSKNPRTFWTWISGKTFEEKIPIFSNVEYSNNSKNYGNFGHFLKTFEFSKKEIIKLK